MINFCEPNHTKPLLLVIYKYCILVKKGASFILRQPHDSVPKFYLILESTFIN